MPISTGNLYGVQVILIVLCCSPVFATINETDLEEPQNHTVVVKKYPLMNTNLEEAGIYTSVQ